MTAATVCHLAIKAFKSNLRGQEYMLAEKEFYDALAAYQRSNPEGKATLPGYYHDDEDLNHCEVCGDKTVYYGSRYAQCGRVVNAAVLAAERKADEEFAQFVFAHFGGFWLQMKPRPDEVALMNNLPLRIAYRVTRLAHEAKRKKDPG